jgi:hypothetical protein
MNVDISAMLKDVWMADGSLIKASSSKGYKILEIQEVYQYEVTRYNPDTSDAGLFYTAYKHISETQSRG